MSGQKTTVETRAGAPSVTLVETSGSVAVRCLVRLTVDRSPTCADAIDAEYVPVAQAFVRADDLGEGAEVFNLLRGSALEPA